MHTLVSKLVALSVEKYYMALAEIQLKICRFHGFLSQKGSRSLAYSTAHSADPIKVPPGAGRPDPLSYATAWKSLLSVTFVGVAFLLACM